MGQAAAEPNILTRCIVEDEDLLAEAVDATITLLDKTDRGLVELAAELAVAEEILRLVEPGGWTAYLKIDELRTARVADLAVLLVRWAFNEGSRSASRRPGEP